MIKRAVQRFLHIPLALALCVPAVFWSVYVMDFGGNEAQNAFLALWKFGGLVPPSIGPEEYQLWRLVLSGLLHLTVSHLLSNVLILCGLSALFARQLGVKKSILLLYTGIPLVALIRCLIDDHWSSGLSGGLALLIGAVLCDISIHRKSTAHAIRIKRESIFIAIVICTLIAILIGQFQSSRSGELTRVDHWAHWFGFCLGGLWGLVMNRYEIILKKMTYRLRLTVNRLLAMSISMYLLSICAWYLSLKGPSGPSFGQSQFISHSPDCEGSAVINLTQILCIDSSKKSPLAQHLGQTHTSTARLGEGRIIVRWFTHHSPHTFYFLSLVPLQTDAQTALDRLGFKAIERVQ